MSLLEQRQLERHSSKNQTVIHTFTTELLDSPEFANLNIGGQIFLLKWSLINKLPNSRLGKILHAASFDELSNLCDEINIDKKELYFDRSPNFFSDISDFYYSDAIHLDMKVCVLSFYYELIYWGMENNEFDTCCSFKFNEMKMNVTEQIEKMNEMEKMFEQMTEVPMFSGRFKILKEKTWNVMENPETSNLAKAITVVSIVFIIISTFTLVTSTLPDFKSVKNITDSHNATHTEEIDHPFFELIETVCIAWFTIEFLVRFWASPKRLKFLKSPLNLIDIISIMPFYLSILLSQLSVGFLQSTKSIRKLFTLFRVLRILRIFKLARHSKGLKAFGKTLKMSINELGILFMFLGIAVLLFSSLAYFAEKDEKDTLYTSIPATFWWAVITITTVGYGDMYPTTFIGRVIGIFCCIGGILVLAMPIPIIVDNFRRICAEEEMREKILHYRMLREQASEGRTSRGSSESSEIIIEYI